jgi:ABC-2 type transport system permease protein
MNAELLFESFRSHRRSLFWWTVGFVGLIGLTMAFYPSVKDSAGLDQYSQDLPEALRALFVGGELDLTSPVGYLNSQVYVMLAPLLLAIFAIGVGASAVAGDEDDGLLDLLLSQPVSRTAFALERFAWLCLSTLLMILVLTVTVVIGALATGLSLSEAHVPAATVSTGLFALLVGTAALAVGSTFPGKSRAIAVAAGLATVSWIVDGLAKAVDWLDGVAAFSPYRIAYGSGPLANGAAWGDWLILAAVILVFAGISIFGLRRRDIRQ